MTEILLLFLIWYNGGSMPLPAKIVLTVITGVSFFCETILAFFKITSDNN